MIYIIGIAAVVLLVCYYTSPKRYVVSARDRGENKE